jgi:hypothetical protein
VFRHSGGRHSTALCRWPCSAYGRTFRSSDTEHGEKPTWATRPSALSAVTDVSRARACSIFSHDGVTLVTFETAQITPNS